jgi:uncharacterized membrane protein
MNPTYIHLLLNHVPILGSVFGALLLLYGIIGKSKSVINAALLTFIVTALFAIPVFLTGEPAEESVENITGINKAAIEEHEESAELALWVMEALGILSLITLIVGRKENSLGNKLTIATLLLSLFTFALMARTGKEGGKIRHTELTNTAQTTGVSGGEQGNEHDEDQ